MKNKFIKWSIKIVCGVLSFLLIFTIFQTLLTPKYLNESSTMVDGYRKLPENSLNAVFIGSSQMFCGIDSKKLTDEYGINSYNFGASSQPITTSAYYLKEALKTQTPDVVMIEATMIFELRNDIQEEALAWNYYPMNPSLDKYKSLCQVTGDDKLKAFQYAFIPVTLYHSRWKSFTAYDLLYYVNYSYDSRGYNTREEITPVDIAFNTTDTNTYTIPQDNAKAVEDMQKLCEEKGITLCSFKTPYAKWTKPMSEEYKRFMEERNIAAIDLNEYIDKMGIDENVDFADVYHLNKTGAVKATDFMGKFLRDKYFN